MNWKTFEKNVHKYFQSRYPEADIVHNVKLQGFKSKTERQIDVLIKQYLAGYEIEIMVECKDWKEPLDVTQVEQIIAKMEDIKISFGVIVTKTGYTKAAKELSKNHGNLQLHVLKFEELADFQSFWGNPYRGNVGAYVFPPNGWLLHAEVPENLSNESLCFLYPMEYSLSDAVNNKYFINFNILINPKRDSTQTLDTILEHQEKGIFDFDPEAKIDISGESTQNGQITIRTTFYPKQKYTETAGFADIGLAVFCVYGLHPHDEEKMFRSHVKFVLQHMLPIVIQDIDPENSHEAWERLLEKTQNTSNIVKFRHK